MNGMATIKALKLVQKMSLRARRAPDGVGNGVWYILIPLATVFGHLSCAHPVMLISPLLFLTSLWKTRIILKSRMVVAAFAAGSGTLVAQPIGEVLGSGSQIQQIFGSTLLSAIIGAPWLCIHGRGLRRFISAGVVATVCLLPPYGAIALSSPYLAAGVLFPNSNIIGLVLIWLMIVVWPVLKTRAKRMSGAALVITSITLNLIYEQPPAPEGWQAVRSTFYDNPDNALASRYDRAQWLVQDATTRLTLGTKLIVYPETILGDMRPGLSPQLDLLAQRASKYDATILIGMSLPTPSGFENALVFLGKDDGQYRARQPVPLMMWNLWSRGGYQAHWWGSGVHTLQGKRTALLICWEEGSPWAMFRSAFAGPEVILSASNHGWSRNGDYRWKDQTVSANALARLYRLPILRSVNVPLRSIRQRHD